MAVSFVFIDTCILIRVVTQGRKGNEIEHLERLFEFADQGKCEVLHPEVVTFEFDKFWRTIDAALKGEVEKFQRRAPKDKSDKPWSEAEDIERAIGPLLDQWKTQKKADCETRWKRVNELLQSPRVHHLPFTPEVLFAGRKRLMSGKMPPKGPDKDRLDQDQDASIIESLREKVGRGQETVYICSDNVGDFTTTVTTEKGDEIAVFPRIKDDVPGAVFCRDLPTLVMYVEKHEVPVEPDRDAVEKAAAEEDIQSRNHEYPTFADLARVYEQEQSTIARLRELAGPSAFARAKETSVISALQAYESSGIAGAFREAEKRRLMFEDIAKSGVAAAMKAENSVANLSKMLDSSGIGQMVKQFREREAEVERLKKLAAGKLPEPPADP